MTGSATAGGAAPRLDVQRLRASRDVRAVFADRRRAAATPAAVLHARVRGDDAPPRVAIVAGKAVGNAVQRNRVKRRLRAAVPALGLRNGADYVIIGRRAALTIPYNELRAGLSRSAASVWTRP